MIYADQGRILDVPENIATCPECGAEIYLEITEWETETGVITEGGFEIGCPKYNTLIEEHGGNPMAWQPTEAKVYKWLSDSVRVADATPDDLSAWNSAVMDWAKV